MSGLRRLELLLTATLAWAVTAPLAGLVPGTLGPDSPWGHLFTSEGTALREATLTSLGVSAATAVLTCGVGGAWAAWTTTRRFRGRRLAAVAPLLPLALPPLVGVMSFLFLWGEVGLLPGLWRTWRDSEPPPPLSGFPAVLLVHVYSFLPLTYLFLRDGMLAVDANLDHAARTLGAGRWVRWRFVWWPQLRPAIFAALWIAFMASMASFSAPYLLGGSGRYLSTEIVARRMGGEEAVAQVETLLLAGLSLALLLLRPLSSRASSTRRAPIRPSPARFGFLHAAGAALGLAILALPHASLLFLSLVEDGTWTWQPLPPSYTLRNHLGLWTDPTAWRPLLRSFLMAAPAVTLGALWSLAVARTEVRGPRRLRPWVGVVASLPWAIPPTALAMAWLAAYNRPTPAGFGLALASTPFLLPWAYTLRFLPLQVRAVTSALQARGMVLEDAARTLGASPWRAARLVTFPVVRPALAGASALAFVLAMGEFVVSILLYVPENRPVSIEILSDLRLFNLGRAAAMGCWVSLLLAMALVLIPNLDRSWNQSSLVQR